MPIENGLFSNALQIASPHFNHRPSDAKISLLVIHNISLPAGRFDNDYVEQFFTAKLDLKIHPSFQDLQDLRVSSHLYIKRDGTVIQFVNLNERAWHAGKSCFKGQDNCNDFSIGIELQGTDHSGYTDRQYQSLVETSKRIQRSYPLITGENICGHNEIAPDRKTDPGDSFDWLRFRRALHNNNPKDRAVV